MFGEMDKKVVVIVLVLLVVGDGLCGGKFRIFLTSPCPDIFQYKYDDYDGRLYGVLRVDCRVPECRALYDKVVQLQVQLSVGNMIYEVICASFKKLAFFLHTWPDVVFFSAIN